MVASTEPRSTRAICRSERRTEGRSQLTVAATQKRSAATATAATITRRATRVVRTDCAISRSMPDRYLTKRDAMAGSLKTKDLRSRKCPLVVRFQAEVFGSGQYLLRECDEVSAGVNVDWIVRIDPCGDRRD